MPSSAFTGLRDYLVNRMRMSHIYQPVMIKTMLQNGGTASIRLLARTFLSHDESQIEYYENVVRRMPGRVLRNNGVVEREGDGFVLHEQYTGASETDTKELTRICDEAVEAFKSKRGGKRLWSYRNRLSRHVPGNVRYNVLKRAGGHCELCGIPAEDRALEIDHILPKKAGGSDDPENLQALCWLCNANKGDRDDTDFGAVRASYEHREPGCPFCEMSNERVVASSRLAYAVRDAYPVTKLHTLVIPRRHVSELIDLHGAEHNAVTALLTEVREEIHGRDQSVEGFNVGTNVGEVAGQSIFHCHVHVIPRRAGDVEKPRGGVRHTIPGRGDYRVPEG